jgi:ribonuclease E
MDTDNNTFDTNSNDVPGDFPSDMPNDTPEHDDVNDASSADDGAASDGKADDGKGDDGAKKKRRRSRRGGRGRRKNKTKDAATEETGSAGEESAEAENADNSGEDRDDAVSDARDAVSEASETDSRDAARETADDAESGDADEGNTDESSDELAADAEAAADTEGDADAPRKPRERRSRDRRSRDDGRSERTDRREKSEKQSNAPFTQMLINYVPGEECRVAIMEDGKLEELHVERFASASRVGNIYVGKVMNVEPAIQAAFVDFGVGENGFLHVTDLHPRYFPGEDDSATERVGLKTPRRERPPIQTALRKGDEIIVQVLKEGVGTKGPTLTSYLSIPGRFLVMMPNMDKVGVSRKVEDEEERRAMREILDQLDLPEGFGFILRTAGMSRTKAELKRDLAYLMRLWKDMEKRRERASSGGGAKARLLYSESDLLVRALRDILTNETHEIIIDNEMALKRGAKFLKIVAPRTSTRLLHYNQKAPMFHTFSVEKQISLIHAREVPLASGGRLVIDQTEALVAIDVNSGRSRDSRDSETNAYQTNIEAVDEICRQLRLRDMGGIVINDLIDMRSISHRKDIENRFKERMKRDRAKSTVLQISEFGILQMTRQRMRASHESVHFTDCPTCRGRGMLQKPDSVAGDALRELSAILDLQRVAKVEMVVAPRVAGDLLSTKRQLLSRIERTYGKHVDVRVSESVPVDRIAFYAYDESGSDIDLSNLPMPRKPRELPEWVDPDASSEADWAPDLDAEAEEARRAEAEEAATQDDADVHPIEIELPDEEVDAEIAASGGRRGRAGEFENRDSRNDRGDRGDRRGRRRRGRDDRRDDRRSDQRDERRNDRPRENARSNEPRREEPRREESRRDDRRSDRRDQPRNEGRDGPRDGGRDNAREESRPQGRSRFNDDAEWGEPAPAGAPRVPDDGSPDASHIVPDDQIEAMPSEESGGNGDGANQEMREGGEGGEGGRRKRRRRRRGRGRGRDDGAMGNGVNANDTNGEPRDDDAREEPRGEMSRDESATDDEGVIANDDDGDEGETTLDGDAPSGQQENGDGEGGRRRRRRRRRRGGGGGSGSGGGDGPRGGQNEQRPPREQPRSDARGEVREPKPARPPEAPRLAAPAPLSAASTPKPPPRTLYGAVRRKLTPGELKNRPKDD